MRYKFEHKSLPIMVEIDITFKQIDLKINITRTWRTEDDGKDNITPLPSSEQDEYIDYFQNIELGIKIEAGCLTQTIFIYPFKLNFIKDYEVKNYKIVGEISGEIEDDDLEEVNLT